MTLSDRLRRWASYLIELPVGRFSSEHNPDMEVVLHRGRYKLLTDGAIYSFGDLYTNFRYAFDRLDWTTGQYRNCLVLGLGLASIPDMLVNRFGRRMRFSAVELDEMVTHLALTYVLRPKGIQVDVFTADAADFLTWHRGKYDLVCSDVFVGDKIPEALQTQEALEAMRDLLSAGGILLYNRLSRYPDDIAESERFRDEVFLPVFPHGGYLDMHGNWVFVSDLRRFQA